MLPRLPGRLLAAAATRTLRDPVMGLSLGAAAAVLALATCATPLYRASVGHAAMGEAIAGFHPESLGLTVSAFGALDAGRLAQADRAVRGAAGAAAGLGRPVLGLVGDARARAVDGEPPAPVQLFARDAVTEHLPDPRPCAEPAGDRAGVWLSDRLAGPLGLEPCDEVVVLDARKRPVTAPVAGVFRDLLDVLETPIWDPPDPLPQGSAIAAYWARDGYLFVQLSPMGDPVPQPPLVLAEPHDLAAATGGTAFAPPLMHTWTFAFAGGSARPAEVALAARAFEAFGADARNLTTPMGQALAAVSGQPQGTFARTLLAEVEARAAATTAAVDTALRPLGLTAQAAALLAVAAGAVFEARRRRTERLLLAAQGSGLLTTAARAALEGFLAVAAGTAVGAVTAAVLVAALGPGGRPEAGTVAGTLPAAAGWAVAALALLAAGAAASARRAEVAVPRAVPGLARHPWEVVALLLAAASYWTLARRGEVLLAVDTPGAGPSMDASYVLFPLLVLAGCAGLAARALPRVAPALRRLARRAPASTYLAASRLAAAPAAAALLVGAAAVGIGVLVYAAGVGASTARTAATSVAVVAGAPAVADLPARREAGPAAFPTTVVARGRADLLPQRLPVDLLAIDPGTFAGVAAWQPRFADRPLEELLAALDRPAGAALPVLVVGAPAGERPSLETNRYRIPVDVVARPSAFPGMTGQRPLVVASAAVLVDVVNATGQSSIDEALLLERDRQLWAAASGDELEQFLGALGPAAGHVRTVDDLQRRQPRLAAARWSLAYLQAVGAAAGLLGLVAVALYLHGRQRSREVAALLLARMGLGRRQHRAAVGLELSGLLLAAVLAGALPGLLAARLVVGAIDPLPRVGPAPEFVVPWPVAGLVLALAAGVCLVAAWAAQRAVDRARPGEALRAAD